MYKSKKELSLTENHSYCEDENEYPKRVKRPVAVLLFAVILALMYVSFSLFR
ncbi:MAG: hypothetical protein JST81_05800 [Bacteroidetes bacterium]|nr:hypothetical protein [Bacteroidota bacterium]